MDSGIYLITCSPVGALPIYYVGQSKNVTTRWVRHRYALNKGDHHNPRLQALWSKYGASSFSFCLLEKCDVSSLCEIEQWWLDEIHGYRRCLNLSKDARAPSRGLKMSKEAVAKSIQNRKPAILTEAQRKAVSERLAPFRGQSLSDQAKAKISASKTGVKNHFFGRSGALSPVARPVVGVCVATGASVRFASASEARSAGFTPNCISRVCLGTRKQHKGYMWSFAATTSSSS